MTKGFDSNPSSFRQRAPVLCAAAIGFAIACYLTLYQLGVASHVWEPLFGNGSRQVLHSSISRRLPIPDASFGALGYLAEFITGAIGGERRWRMMPRLVLFYGAIVAALACAGIALSVLQPLVVHSGCTLCLTSAAISLLIAWLARREVFASFRRLRCE